MQYTTRLDDDPRKAHINYQCPCGCTAGILYDREAGPAELGECCCGRLLSAGSDAETRVRSALEAGVEYVWDLGRLTLPWGEVIETALAVPAGELAAGNGEGRDHEPAATPATLVKDVVCGMIIDPQGAAATSSYRGQIYYFCAPDCKVRFDDNPESFVGVERRGLLGRLFRR